ncbi:MAG: hypothetical protein ABH810_04260 [bacterium]
MNLIDQIINQARNILYCPVCNNQYDKDRIRFRGFIDNTYIFHAYCNLNHQPIAITYLASLHRIDQPISTYFHLLSGEKISKEMVKNAEKILDTHKGSIAGLFDQ